jgi:ABC-2 type transport system ATP-binding protein
LHQNIIEIDGLTKHFGDFKALDDIDINVEEGKVFGYLGPNGAGKTTTIKVLLGLLKPTSGRYRLFGVEPATNHTEVYSRVGYAPELPNLPTFMTGDELLDFTGKLYGLVESARRRRTRLMMEVVGLGGIGSRKIGKFSKGMVQRLSVAQSLMGSPELLILDEPTIGMDPEGKAWFRDIFHQLGMEGVTVFLSSHMLEEVERICDRVGIINRGRIVSTGSLDDIRETFTEKWRLEVELVDLSKKMVEAVKKLRFVEKVDVEDGTMNITMVEKEDRRAEVSKTIVKAGGVITGMRLSKTTLEEAYLRAVRGR